MAEDKINEKVISFVLDQLKLGEAKDSSMKLLLQKTFGYTEQDRIKLMSLMNQSSLITIKSLGEDIIYSLPNKTKRNNVQEIDKIEDQVYQLILNQESKGITKSDIKKQLNLNQILISKILKKLTTKGFINSHKTKRRNVYIYLASEFVPEENLVGGNLYQQGDIDEGFVQKLEERITSTLKEQDGTTYNQLLGIVSSNEGKFLNEQEIQSIINMMIFDNKIVKKQKKFYVQTSQNFLESDMTIPCDNCPFVDSCVVGSVISPENCLFFDNWQLICK